MSRPALRVGEGRLGRIGVFEAGAREVPTAVPLPQATNGRSRQGRTSPAEALLVTLTLVLAGFLALCARRAMYAPWLAAAPPTSIALLPIPTGD